MSEIDHRPISVVSSDQQALKTLMTLHAVPNPRIVDCTHNEGRMWQRTEYEPYRVDINPDLKTKGLIDVVADFRKLPFDEASYDVAVFDPPHVTDAGKTGLHGDPGGWGERFGTSGDDVHGKLNVSHLFEPFLLEAQRILVPKTGVVFAKIADQVHGARYQWQHCDLKDAALKVGMTPCDLILVIQYNRGGLNDPRWKHVYHVRQVHCYWMAIRNAPDLCCSPNAPTIVRNKSMTMFEDVA